MLFSFIVFDKHIEVPYWEKTAEVIWKR